MMDFEAVSIHEDQHSRRRPAPDPLALQGAIANAFAQGTGMPSGSCPSCTSSAFTARAVAAPIVQRPAATGPQPPATSQPPPVMWPPGSVQVPGAVSPAPTGSVVNATALFDGHPEDDVAFFEGLVDEAAPGMQLLAHRIEAANPTRATLLYGDISFASGVEGGIGEVYVTVLEERNTSPFGACPMPGIPTSNPCFAGYRILGSGRGVRAFYMRPQDTDDPPLDAAQLDQAFEDGTTEAIEQEIAGSNPPSIDSAGVVVYQLSWKLEYAAREEGFFTASTIPTATTVTLELLVEKWFHVDPTGFSSLCDDLGVGSTSIDEWDVTLEAAPSAPVAIDPPEPGTVPVFPGLCASMEQVTLFVWDRVKNLGSPEVSQLVGSGAPLTLAGGTLFEAVTSVARSYDARVVRELCPCY